MVWNQTSFISWFHICHGALSNFDIYCHCLLVIPCLGRSLFCHSNVTDKQTLACWSCPSLDICLIHFKGTINTESNSTTWTEQLCLACPQDHHSILATTGVADIAISSCQQERDISISFQPWQQQGPLSDWWKNKGPHGAHRAAEQQTGAAGGTKAALAYRLAAWNPPLLRCRGTKSH